MQGGAEVSFRSLPPSLDHTAVGVVVSVSMMLERTVILALVGSMTGVAAAQAPSAASTTPGEAAPEVAADRPSELLGADGVRAFQARDFSAADRSLADAHRRAPTPRLGLWRARALVQLGGLLAAERLLAEVVAMDEVKVAAVVAEARAAGLAVEKSSAQMQARRRAEVELEQLRERIPTLTMRVIHATPASVQLTINGQAHEVTAVARRFDPGDYRIVGRFGDSTVVRSIVLTERDAATVGLDFTPPPPPDDRGATQRTVGWVAVGIGGAGVAVGAVIGAIAIAQLGDADCPDDQCPPEEYDTADEYNALRMPSGISLVAGGMIGALGVGLLISAPSQPESMSAWVGPAGFGLRGQL